MILVGQVNRSLCGGSLLRCGAHVESPRFRELNTRWVSHKSAVLMVWPVNSVRPWRTEVPRRPASRGAPDTRGCRYTSGLERLGWMAADARLAGAPARAGRTLQTQETDYADAALPTESPAGKPTRKPRRKVAPGPLGGRLSPDQRQPARFLCRADFERR